MSTSEKVILLKTIMGIRFYLFKKRVGSKSYLYTNTSTA